MTVNYSPRQWSPTVRTLVLEGEKSVVRRPEDRDISRWGTHNAGSGGGNIAQAGPPLSSLTVCSWSCSGSSLCSTGYSAAAAISISGVYFRRASAF